jgi:hypothetical protein
MKNYRKFTWIITFFLLALGTFVACTKSGSNPNSTNTTNGGTGGNSTTPGTASFWTSQATGWTSLTVSVNNAVVGATSKYFSTTPNCGADGAITITRPPGNYAYTATSNSGVTWAGTVTVTAGGCTTQRLDFPAGTGGTGGTGGTTQTGNVAFWTSQSSGWSTITVNIGGTFAGTIAGNYFSATPACGANGTVTVSKAPGTYSYTASSNTGVTWSGTFTITAGGCSPVRLDFPSGGTTGGGTGTSTAANLVFWTTQSSGWSSISIYQADGTPGGKLVGTLTGYFNAKPACGANGTVTTPISTVTFPYPFFAKSNTGITWPEFTVFAGAAGTCSSVQLNFPTNGGTSGTVTYIQGK